MSAIDLFGCNPISMAGIKKFKIATRDANDNPLVFPLDIVLKANDESIIVCTEDEDAQVIYLGSQTIKYRNVTPLYSSIKEEEVTDRQGRFYRQTLAWEMPQLNLNTLNQLKEFLFTSGGEFAISEAVCFIQDMNDNYWICGYASPLILENFDLQTGAVAEDNKYVLSYICRSYQKIKQYEPSEYILTLPELLTTAVTDISTTGATSGGDVFYGGNSAVTLRGICWATTQNPTIGNSKTSQAGTTGSFTSQITGLNGLTGATTYYVRAYAINRAGVGYGAQESFSTPAVSVPVVTTATIAAITTTGCTSGGEVTDDGGGVVSARGICWSTSVNPTIADSHTHNSSGTGTYTSTLTGLTSGTLYHVRAYATNGVGTGYGSDLSFGTKITGLQAEWLFEDNLNDSINGYNISGAAGASYVTGLIGKGITKTSGTGGQWTDVTSTAFRNLIAGTSAFSYSGWFKSGTNDNKYLFTTSLYGSQRIGLNLFMNSSQDNEYQHRGDSGVEAFAYNFSASTWYHVVLTFNGTQTKVYINGNSTPVLTYNESDNITLTSNHKVSPIDEIRADDIVDNIYFYNKALSTAEIAFLYNSGSGI